MTVSQEFESVSLREISGLSPLNPRQDLDSDVSMLVATIKARGLLHPLLVQWNSERSGYSVLAGGRRWRALCQIGDEERLVPVKVFIGSDAQAREAALAESATQKPLHPVEEFEAFAALADEGFSIEAIARDFALTERHVKQRLALARLSPRVRALWREGKISRDIAEAFTAGTIEAQEAHLDSVSSDPAFFRSAYSIRNKLRGRVESGESALGKFLLSAKERVSRYVDAGGRIEESLFEDEILLIDGELAERVAGELLLEAAQRAAEAEGWGAATVDDMADDWLHVQEPDFTPEEENRLQDIESSLRKPESDKRALRAEESEIARQALLRSIPEEERAKLGVRAFISEEGEIGFDRGVPLDDARAEPEAAHSDAPGENQTAAQNENAETPKKEKSEQADASKQLRAVIDDVATRVFREVVRNRGDLAMAIAVASIACSYENDVSAMWMRPYVTIEPTSYLLRDIIAAKFSDALLACVKAPLNDLSTAFFELVSLSIDATEAPREYLDAFAEALCYRGAPLGSAFEKAIDRVAFFEAAPKDMALSAVRGLIGEAEASRVSRLKKRKLAEYVAKLSEEQKHLPAPFSQWANYPVDPAAREESIDSSTQPSLAQAMNSAISADEKKKRRSKKAA
jgi:ParB family chromosome partitioning protein